MRKEHWPTIWSGKPPCGGTDRAALTESERLDALRSAPYTTSTSVRRREKRRAWLQREFDEAEAWGQVKLLPSFVHVHCRRCGNNRRVAVPYGRLNARFRCSRCGTRI